jgi:hypothetical protein
VAAIGISTAAGVMKSDPGGGEGLLYSAAMIIGGVAVPWLFAFRPRVVLTDSEVRIVNPFGTTNISLERIAPLVEPSYSGVVVLALKDGHMQKTAAWAVQKSNLARWTGRPTRADEICRTIAQAAERVQRRSMEH